MISKIHVNRHVLAKNKKAGERIPPLTIRTYKGATTASELEIRGPCRLVYAPDDPLPCGATVYLITESDVVVIR